MAGVALSRGKVLVDEADQTTAAHIYAIGDVATGIKTRIIFTLFNRHLIVIEYIVIYVFVCHVYSDLPHVAPDQVDAIDRPELTYGS